MTDERAQLVNEIYSGAPNYFSDNEDAVVLSIARDNKFTLDWGWLYYKEQIEVPIGIKFQDHSSGDRNLRHGERHWGRWRRNAPVSRWGEFLLNPSLGNVSFGVSFTDIAGTQLAWSTQRTEIIPMQIQWRHCITRSRSRFFIPWLPFPPITCSTNGPCLASVGNDV